MDAYFLVKLTHIVSSTVLFGTGLGTAFFLWCAYRSGNVQALAVTARHTVWADCLFTTPAVIVQPLTGIWLWQRIGYPLSSSWLWTALALFVFAGLCWLPVLWLQLRVRDFAVAAAEQGTALDPRAHRYMRWWFLLGCPAFLAVLAVFALMTLKPAFW